MIRLETLDLKSELAREVRQLGIDLLQRQRAVDRRFPLAYQIQIGSVQNEDLHPRSPRR